MNLQWSEWVIIALGLIILFGPAICFWWAGHVWEKCDKKETKEGLTSYSRRQTKAFDRCSYRGNCLTDCTYRADCPYYSY